MPEKLEAAKVLFIDDVPFLLKGNDIIPWPGDSGDGNGGNGSLPVPDWKLIEMV